MCAVFGLIDFRRCFDNKMRERILRVLSTECEIRGTDATGYTFNESGSLRIVKKPVPAHKLRLRLTNEANIIHGHTRMATQGSAINNINNHPFPGTAGVTSFALAHNGILRNEMAVRRELGIKEELIETDSFLAVQVLEKLGELSMETLAEMAETVEGEFVFTVLDEHNNSYFVRGLNPLAMYKFEAGFYIYASTRTILDSALMKLNPARLKYEEIETRCGDILKIDKDGNLTRSSFDSSDLFYGEYYYPYHRSFWYEDFDGRDSEAAKQLITFANTIGISADDVDLLLDFGYDLEEIEELFYIPGAFQEALCMALGSLYEEDF